jgi:proteic killer suppression protein
MIQSFTHKGLKELFTTGKSKRLPQERLGKIKLILASIQAATKVGDLNMPGARLHKLKAPPYAGFWSLDVSGNFRIIFRFEDGNASDINYLDTH